ncbi:TetR/AcrR family transcriptional regulator [Opitutia bacterium ISCC 51]|nr:TetR/AcrR family transcriptional regulator [Opitutae bacterium ISCC 51]QXD27945.1 TetR/AcrR family transcriptional regulator [Opitutae bacterium ISCC 52]
MSPHVKAPEETRARILQVAMEEIHMQGFQGVSINKIVEKAGVTKGALFHHFKGKNELGYAVVDEVISREIHEFWIKPIANSVDPVKDLKKILFEAKNEFLENPEMLVKGCPLSNLAHEMAPLDTTFREKIENQFSRWRGVLQKAFEAGKTAGTVKQEVEADVAAVFIVSALEGLISTCKSSHNMELAAKVMKGFFAYLDSLKN